AAPARPAGRGAPADLRQRVSTPSPALLLAVERNGLADAGLTTADDPAAPVGRRSPRTPARWPAHRRHPATERERPPEGRHGTARPDAHDDEHLQPRQARPGPRGRPPDGRPAAGGQIAATTANTDDSAALPEENGLVTRVELKGLEPL